jgi:hypothetical protein
MKVDWRPLFTMDTSDERLVYLETKISSLLNQHMPLRPSKKCPSDRPWVTVQFKDLLIERHKAFKSGNTILYKQLRNKANRMNRSLRSAFYQSKVEELKCTNSKKWWNGVKQLTGQAITSGNELSGLANNLCDGDNTQLANLINEFFQSVSADLPKLDKSRLPPRSDHIPDKYIISVLDVEKQLMKLDISKAPGPDGIPTWILHDFPGILAPPVCSIFNASIREGHLPGLWKSATSRPIPKVSPPKQVEKDLRPISLTCILSKELETHVVRWMWELVKDKMDPYQFGSIKNCSTVHALIEILHEWFTGTDDSREKNFIHTVLVDYSKAFDRINPNMLLDKLNELDIPPFLVCWIGDFLSERTQRVKVGNSLSEELEVWGIVPQGTKLGIFLFLIMINNLSTQVATYKYVDDTTLFTITNDTNDSKLQQAVDDLVNWSAMNDMKINATKTKEMVISFSKVAPDIPGIVVEGITLERAETVKLLGVQISNDLSWGHHVDFIVKKAQSRLFCLNMLRRAKMRANDIIAIFCSKVRPILEYAAQVWHPGLTTEQAETIEAIQKRACSIAMPGVDYVCAIKELALPTLEERRVELCKSFFEKIQNPKDKLFRILPPIQDNIKNTRKHKKYALPKARTNRLKKSFLPYALSTFQ